MRRVTVATAAMRARRAALFALAAALFAVKPGEVRAQAAPGDATRYEWKDAPLAEALYELADASGVSLVFAHRLVEGRAVSAVYRAGDEPDAALAQLLQGTGLRAARMPLRRHRRAAQRGRRPR
jgi:hypothetical protein